MKRSLVRTLTDANEFDDPTYLAFDERGVLFNKDMPSPDLTCFELSFYPRVVWETIDRFMHMIRAVHMGYARDGIPVHEEERNNARVLARVREVGRAEFNVCVSMGKGHFLVCNGRIVYVVHVGEGTTFLREVECVGAGLRALELRAYCNGYAFLTEALTEFMHIVPVSTEALQITDIKVEGDPSPSGLSRTLLIRDVITCAVSPEGLLATVSAEDSRLWLTTRVFSPTCITRETVDLKSADSLSMPLEATLRNTVSLAFHGSQLVVATCHSAPEGATTHASHVELFVREVYPDGYMTHANVVRVVVPSTRYDRFFDHRTTLRRAKNGTGLILTCTCFPKGLYYTLA